MGKKVDAVLRVIIADDEARICKLIQILADWEGLGMEVVGTADNGLDAVAQVALLRPDILITDIRMPGCDGLEVIHRAKAAQPALEVIIISGYAQFDYAQTAIQYGVGEYLLKPINKEALNGTLAKMGERCRMRQAADDDRERLRLHQMDDRERLREALLDDLLAGDYAARDAQALSSAYCFGGEGGTYQACVLKMDFEAASFHEQSLQIVEERAKDIFQAELVPLCGDVLLGRRDAAIFGVLHYAPGAQGEVRARLRECLNQLIALRGLFGDVTFSLSLGRPAQEAVQLLQSMENARRVICERMMEGTDRLLEGEPEASALREASLLARYAQAAGRAIDVLSVPDADAASDALARAACAIPRVRGFELLALVQGAGVAFVTRLGMEDHAQAIAAFERACGQCCRVDALFACLRTLQRTQLEAAQALRRSQDAMPIRMAKQYIQQRYAQPLTLEEVSAETGFSVSYFSTLFKKETGEGFAKYLARVRMEAAKGLLRETRLSVAEVCHQVGYEDIKHFTRMFKAETGLTPGEFRKLYG